MLIIPVVDLFDRQVVHARRGQREHYRPIVSSLCKSSDPFSIVTRLLEVTGSPIVYCADLAALQDKGEQHSLIAELAGRWPRVMFWIDSGTTLACTSPLFGKHDNVVNVIGTESYRSFAQLTSALDKTRSACALSLDFMEGRLLGPQEILTRPQCWPAHVIVMSLDHVGADTGPCFSLLETILPLAKKNAVYAAGGVRNRSDIAALSKQGVRGALVASALHNGALTASPGTEFVS